MIHNHIIITLLIKLRSLFSSEIKYDQVLSWGVKANSMQNWEWCVTRCTTLNHVRVCVCAGLAG